MIILGIPKCIIIGQQAFFFTHSLFNIDFGGLIVVITGKLL